MTVFVYGGGGRTGRAVIQELSARGACVVAGGRGHRRSEPRGDVPWRVASAESPEELRTAFRGCEGVVQCASLDKRQSTTVAAAAVEAGIPYVDVCADRDCQEAVRRRVSNPAQRSGVGVCVGAAPIGGALGEWLATAAAERFDGADQGVRHLGVAYMSEGLPGSGGSLDSSVRMLLTRERSLPGVTFSFPPPFGPQPAFSFPLGLGCLQERFPDASVETYAAMQLGPIRPREVSTAVRWVRRLPLMPEVRGLVSNIVKAAAAFDVVRAAAHDLEFSVVAEAVSSTHRAGFAIVAARPYELTAWIATTMLARLRCGAGRAGVIGVSELLDSGRALDTLAQRGLVRLYCSPATPLSQAELG